MKCKHLKLKSLYYRKLTDSKKSQVWMKILNFMVCEDCGEILKLTYERNKTKEKKE